MCGNSASLWVNMVLFPVSWTLFNNLSKKKQNKKKHTSERKMRLDSSRQNFLPSLPNNLKTVNPFHREIKNLHFH